MHQFLALVNTQRKQKKGMFSRELHHLMPTKIGYCYLHRELITMEFAR